MVDEKLTSPPKDEDPKVGPKTVQKAQYQVEVLDLNRLLEDPAVLDTPQKLSRTESCP